MQKSASVKLSVVIPAFNASAYIRECLKSVVAQEGCPPFEIIVVDDGSTDDTAAIIESEFPEVRLIQKANGGPGSARNVGVENARGEITLFIDADDVMLPGRLAFQGEFMLQNPRIGLSFGNQQFQLQPEYDANLDRGICWSSEFTVIEDAYARLLTNGNYVANTACAVRTAIYRQVGGQPTAFFVGEDYAMNCAIARQWPIAGSNRFLTWYRQGHGGNLMASKHTYYGPVRVLGAELRAHGVRLTPDQYRRAYLRWCHLANMLLRWVWIEAGHPAVCAELPNLRPLLPRRMQIKWWVLSLLPRTLGRGARRMKRHGQSVSAKLGKLTGR